MLCNIIAIIRVLVKVLPAVILWAYGANELWAHKQNDFCLADLKSFVIRDLIGFHYAPIDVKKSDARRDTNLLVRECEILVYEDADCVGYEVAESWVNIRSVEARDPTDHFKDADVCSVVFFSSIRYIEDVFQVEVYVSMGDMASTHYHYVVKRYQDGFVLVVRERWAKT